MPLATPTASRSSNAPLGADVLWHKRRFSGYAVYALECWNCYGDDELARKHGLALVSFFLGIPVVLTVVCLWLGVFVGWSSRPDNKELSRPGT